MKSFDNEDESLGACWSWREWGVGSALQLCFELSMCRDKSVVRKIYCSNKAVSNEGWTSQKFQLCGWTGKVLYKKKLQIMCSRNWVWMDVSEV